MNRNIAIGYIYNILIYFSKKHFKHTHKTLLHVRNHLFYVYTLVYHNTFKRNFKIIEAYIYIKYTSYHFFSESQNKNIAKLLYFLWRYH